MRVRLKARRMATSKGFVGQDEIVDLPDAAVKKIMVLQPHIVEILEDEAPAFKSNAAKKPTRKRARNADGTLKADDKSTPDVNEAYEDG